MNNSTVTADNLKTLLGKLTPKARTVELNDGTDLFVAGVLDSLSIVQFITLLEKRFDIIFNYNDLRFEHFRSLTQMQSLLQQQYGL